MELPKNITQIGESDRRCKIYVEDYVISYMKQLNQVAEDKEMAVALYGIHREENGVSYLFLYGAGKLNFLQKETRHLSQAQQQEIEKLREKYFRDYTFLGYRLLNGEMIEGFHVCEQGICRYISGYAQFYEKNDSMLAYMLDARAEKTPEVVDREKYDVVKKRQEERKSRQEEHRYQKHSPAVKDAGSSASADSGAGGSSKGSSNSLRGMRVAVVAVFALLCVIGLTSMNGEGKLDELQAVARQVIDEAMEQRIPNAGDGSDGAVEVDTLIAEDKLAEAIQKENVEAVSASGVTAPSADAQEITPTAETQETVSASEQSATPETTQTSENMQTAETEAEQQSGTEQETEADRQSEAAAEEPSVEETAAQPVSYTIKEGDTLIAISVRNYGSDTKVSEICSLNQIDNPDDIKVGQKILLP